MSKKLQVLDQVHFKKIYNDWISQNFSAFLKKLTTTRSSHFLSPNGQGYNFLHSTWMWNTFLQNESVSIKYVTWRNIHPSSYFRSHSTKPPYLLLMCQSYWMNCWPPQVQKKSALIDKANDALKLVEQIAHPLANTRGNIKKAIIERESFHKID